MWPKDSGPVRLVNVRETKMKNCLIVTLEHRAGDVVRKVSLKVFLNLRLHSTGVYCVEMIDEVVMFVRNWFAQSNVYIMEEEAVRRVCAVWYHVNVDIQQLNLNLDVVQEVLGDANILCMYNPAKYSGVRVFLPLHGTEKTASVNVFRTGALVIIVSTPLERQEADWGFVQSRIKTLLGCSRVQGSLVQPGGSSRSRKRQRACN